MGEKFIDNLLKILLKNRWLKNNGYTSEDKREKNCILLKYNPDETNKDKN